MTVSAESADVIVVGGGIAGLSVAALLAPQCRVILLERELLLASQASGNNAAIHRPLEHDAFSAQLATRSRELLHELVGDDVLARTGLCLVSEHAAAVDELAQVALEQKLRHARMSGSELVRCVPWLADGAAVHGLCLTDGGVLDLHALTTRLAGYARRHGAQLRTACKVEALELTTDRGRITGVVVGGARLAAEHVVLAAGAWSAELGQRAGLSLPLTPLRRHLVQLRPASSAAISGQPVAWRLEDEVYFRPESGGVLASPCDETAWSAEIPPVDPEALIVLAHKLERTAPALAHAHVQRAWACLRTFTPDRELAVGVDPRVRGMHWLSGLGGRGMSIALAAAEILTQALLRPPPQAASYARLSVARLL